MPTNPYKKRLGERIRERRLQLGKTQTQLAVELGLSKQTISHWEAGIWAPEMAKLMSVAEALGTDSANLISGLTQEVVGDTPVRRRLAAASAIVPLYDIATCGKILLDDGDEGEPMRFVATFHPHSGKSIGMVISDRANAPKFLPNDLVTLDPLISAQPGQFVLAFADGVTIFRRIAHKRLGITAGAQLLALNQNYPVTTMKSSDKVLATMVEHISTNHD